MRWANVCRHVYDADFLRIGCLSQLSFSRIVFIAPTPLPFSHRFPSGFRNRGFPESMGAVFISRRLSSATSGRTGILRVFLVFDEYTRHIMPRGVSSTSFAVMCANSQYGRSPVWMAAKRNWRNGSSVVLYTSSSSSLENDSSRGCDFGFLSPLRGLGISKFSWT